MPSESKPRRGHLAWLCAGVTLVVVGLVLRLLVARGDLWLDEIWSLNLAGQAGTWMNVFTAIHSDNNHYLTTLWLQQAGPAAPSLLLRLPSVLAGLLTMLVILCRPLGTTRREALAWLFLVALSPILIEYDSEARGYGLAVACAVTMAWMLGRYLQGGRRAWLVGVGLAASLGLLAHLTFAFAIAGCFAWAGLSWWRQRDSGLPSWHLVLAFMAPALVVGVLWTLDLRFLQVGGASPYVLSDVIGSLLGYSMGLPLRPLPWLGFLVAPLAIWEIVGLARKGRPEWILFATTLFIAPAVLVGFARPTILTPRYFLVGVPFLLLLLGRALARISFDRRWVAGGLGLASLLATSVQNRDLVLKMRGSYRQAVADMASQAPAGDQTLGSDQDFRNWIVLAYYLPRHPMALGLRYLPEDSATAHPPYWFLRHEFATDAPCVSQIRILEGRSYTFVKAYPHAGLSGWDWLLYRREEPHS